MTDTPTPTPGPWIAAARYGAEWIGCPVVSSTGRAICSMRYIRHSARTADEKAWDEESKANARFLVAACTAFHTAAERLGMNPLDLAERLKDGGIVTLIDALEGMLKEFRAFRSMPVAAPHSPARLEQQAQMAVEDLARDIIGRVKP